ncbi:MAG: F0F1 ATP synthase subunit A [Fluviicola sp.]|nr:F0F1 ATP synthase subunit A [Fluviicola sp.]
MYKVVRILLVLAVLSPAVLFANEPEHGHDEHATSPSAELTPAEKRKQNTEYVKHHTSDSHDFGLFTNQSTGKHYGFPLPVILWDEGLHFFMSSKFEHGHVVAESKGNFYKLDHGKIYKTDAEGTILTKTRIDKKSGEEIVAQLKPLDFSITRNVFVTLLMVIFIFFIFRKTAKSYQSGLAPSGPAKFLEPIVIFVRDEIAIPNIGEKHYKKYMNYLLTVFFFIWFLNLFGMTPLGGNVTGNIALTFALAMITFIITHATAKKDYWLHIFWMPGIPWPMKILLAPIEVIGVFVKPFALMIRLYANMLAGHIVLGSLIAAVYYFSNYGAKGAFLGLTFFMNIIELLVCVLQAYIFTMLTALYFGSASAEHEHDHAEAH